MTWSRRLLSYAALGAFLMVLFWATSRVDMRAISIITGLGLVASLVGAIRSPTVGGRVVALGGVFMGLSLLIRFEAMLPPSLEFVPLSMTFVSLALSFYGIRLLWQESVDVGGWRGGGWGGPQR